MKKNIFRTPQVSWGNSEKTISYLHTKYNLNKHYIMKMNYYYEIN